jgi:hypothetical protein
LGLSDEETNFRVIIAFAFPVKIEHVDGRQREVTCFPETAWVELYHHP